jgi:hypothetical protein
MERLGLMRNPSGGRPRLKRGGVDALAFGGSGCLPIGTWSGPSRGYPRSSPVRFWGTPATLLSGFWSQRLQNPAKSGLKTVGPFYAPLIGLRGKRLPSRRKAARMLKTVAPGRFVFSLAWFSASCMYRRAVRGSMSC